MHRGSGGGIESVLKEIPPVTRAFVGGLGLFTLLIALGLFKVEYIMMYWPLVLKRFHIWRILTDFLYIGPFGFGWIFHIWLFTSYSSQLEKHRTFSKAVTGSEGTYLYFLILQMVTLQVLTLVFFFPEGKPLMGGSLSFAIIYYWAKREPFVNVSLWGIPLLGWQLPYALIVLDVLMGHPFWQDVMGVCSAHLYYYLHDVLPTEHGSSWKLLQNTPAVFESITHYLNPYHQRPPAQQEQRPRSYEYASGRIGGSWGDRATAYDRRNN